MNDAEPSRDPDDPPRDPPAAPSTPYRRPDGRGMYGTDQRGCRGTRPEPERVNLVEAEDRELSFEAAPMQGRSEPPRAGKLEIQGAARRRRSGRSLDGAAARHPAHDDVIWLIGGARIRVRARVDRPGEPSEGVHELVIGWSEARHASKIGLGKEETPVEAPHRVKLGFHRPRQGTTGSRLSPPCGDLIPPVCLPTGRTKLVPR